MNTRRRSILIGAALFGLGAWAAITSGRSIWFPLYLRLRGRRTVADALSAIGPEPRNAISKRFAAVNVPYPPKRVALLAFKGERVVELWAFAGGKWAPIHTYAVHGSSGGPGPKLREGDGQVPEGLYPLVGLNPNSSFHLSIKVGYPNAFDRERASSDGRTNLGGDIFIHGKATSVGCLAMGDPAIEELFILLADVGHENAELIVAPHDPRSGRTLTTDPELPWTRELYAEIEESLGRFSLKAEEQNES